MRYFLGSEISKIKSVSHYQYKNVVILRICDINVAFLKSSIYSVGPVSSVPAKT